MNATADILDTIVPGDAGSVTDDATPVAPSAAAHPDALRAWIRAQAVNVTRHAAALRPFQREEFGSGAASPTEAHVGAVNALIDRLRQQLFALTSKLTGAATAASRAAAGDGGVTEALQRLMRHKDTAHNWVRAVEQVWDFYLELFGQRQSRYADWLLSCDRIALDCYQAAYLGLGVARPIPTPPPFSYMRTGFGPATFRRGIRLRRLGQLENPFPLVQLPYHRLVNPWTLGAVLHEVSHNLQNDLGLEQAIPRAVGLRLIRAGIDRAVAQVWVRWNRETFADLCGLLLGGPAIVGSLMDVVGRATDVTVGFDPRGVHPTPYLRTFVSIELLRRMGFPEAAAAYRRVWTATYPRSTAAAGLPAELLDTAGQAIPLVVDAMCYQPFPSLGDLALAQVIRFAPKEQQMVEEAARRVSSGTDPGVIPARFLIGAVRVAVDRRLAPPATITRNFYRELSRR